MPSNLGLEALRSLSTIFTAGQFRRIASTGDPTPFARKIQRFCDDFGGGQFGSLIRKLYGELLLDYRNEYIFKNSLFCQELLAKYSLSDTTMLDEVRVGASVADAILLNGEVRVFEIKTDLDSLEKLDKQVEDYRRIADRIYIVAGLRTLDRVFQKYRKSDLGIIVLDADGVLHTVKKSRLQTELLDHAALFKLLRKPEYTSLIREYYGKVPEVPNTQVFSECLNLAKEIEVVTFQALVREKLKLRTLRCPAMLASRRTPEVLKYVCHRLDLSAIEYKNLYSALGRRL